MPLAPAQFFEGQITLADTGKPAAGVKVGVWARLFSTESRAVVPIVPTLRIQLLNQSLCSDRRFAICYD